MADRIFISELAQAESVNDDLMFVSDDGTQTNKVKASQIADYIKDNLGDVGTVKSVNDVLPDESGNITLTAEDIGITSSSGGGINPNLLDNWYFGNPVNQRGQTEYSGDKYTIDRWRTRNTNLTVKLEGGIVLTNVDTSGGQQFVQYLSPELTEALNGKVVTISCLMGNGNFYSFEGKGGVSSNNYTDMNAEENCYVQLALGNGDLQSIQIYCVANKTSSKIVAIKLELGSQQTLAHQNADGTWVLNEIPNYAEELAKCQRHAVVYTAISTGFYWTCHAITDTQAYMTISLPQNIRKLPTVTFDTSAFSLRTGSEPFAISGVSVYTSSANLLVLRVNSTNFTVGSVYSLRGNASAKIVISADL